MIYRLIVLNGTARGQRITVLDTPVTLGRGEDCTFRVEDDEAAIHHAVVEHTASGMYIRDLGTMSHILVNNREIGEARLKHGDVVELGRTRFLVQVSVQAEVNGSGGGGVPPRRRRSSPAFAMFLLLVCAGAAGVFAYHYWPSRPGEYIGPEVTAIEVEDVPRETPADVPGAATNAPHKAPSDAAHAETAVTTGVATAEMVAAVEPEPSRVVPLPEDRPEPEPAPSAPTPPPEPDPPAPPPAPTALIGVAEVSQSRFPQAEDFAEMRLVRIRLAPKVPVDTIDSSDIRVQVAFYDRGRQTGTIAQSQAIVTVGPLEPAGPWLPGQKRTLEATYVVPKAWVGTRRHDGRYYGHVVRVYYGKTLQDVYARPTDLVDLPPPN